MATTSAMRWTKDQYGDLMSGFSYSICEVKAGCSFCQEDGITAGGYVAYFAGSSLCEPTTLPKAKAAAKAHRTASEANSELIRRNGW